MTVLLLTLPLVGSVACHRVGLETHPAMAVGVPHVALRYQAACRPLSISQPSHEMPQSDIGFGYISSLTRGAFPRLSSAGGLADSLQNPQPRAEKGKPTPRHRPPRRSPSSQALPGGLWLTCLHRVSPHSRREKAMWEKERGWGRCFDQFGDPTNHLGGRSTTIGLFTIACRAFLCARDTYPPADPGWLACIRVRDDAGLVKTCYE